MGWKIDGFPYGWIDRRISIWVDKRSFYMDGWIDGCLYGWVDKWIIIWTDGEWNLNIDESAAGF